MRLEKLGMAVAGAVAADSGRCMVKASYRGASRATKANGARQCCAQRAERRSAEAPVDKLRFDGQHQPRCNIPGARECATYSLTLPLSRPGWAAAPAHRPTAMEEDHHERDIPARPR